jgi:putative NADH-flavin reductase
MTSAKRSMRLFILGATGGTGRELVDQALKRQHRVTAFVRTPQKLGAPREGLTVLEGDPLSPQALEATLTGHDAVLSAIGPPGSGRTTVTRDSAQAALAAMRATGVRRLLTLSVAVLFHDGGWLAAFLRKTFLRDIADDAVEMERVVTASDLDWTIVRPPRLTSGPLSQQYGVDDDQLPRGAVRPVALGEGLPLFKDLRAPLRLELVDAQTYNTGEALHVYRHAPPTS